jgi:hypothetical protein
VSRADDLEMARKCIDKAFRALVAAQRASERGMEARMRHPVGSSRAKSTTLNANWARSAEHRDRCEECLSRLGVNVLVAVEKTSIPGGSK